MWRGDDEISFGIDRYHNIDSVKTYELVEMWFGRDFRELPYLSLKITNSYDSNGGLIMEPDAIKAHENIKNTCFELDNHIYLLDIMIYQNMSQINDNNFSVCLFQLYCLALPLILSTT